MYYLRTVYIHSSGFLARQSCPSSSSSSDGGGSTLAGNGAGSATTSSRAAAVAGGTRVLLGASGPPPLVASSSSGGGSGADDDTGTTLWSGVRVTVEPLSPSPVVRFRVWNSLDSGQYNLCKSFRMICCKSLPVVLRNGS